MYLQISKLHFWQKKYNGDLYVSLSKEYMHKYTEINLVNYLFDDNTY